MWVVEKGLRTTESQNIKYDRKSKIENGVTFVLAVLPWDTIAIVRGIFWRVSRREPMER